MIHCCHCGAEIPQRANICPVCTALVPQLGLALASTAELPVSPPLSLPSSPYYGVGGWLALFILGLIVFRPLFFIFQIGQYVLLLREATKVSAHPYSFFAWAIATRLLHFALIIYGFIAGILLLRIRPHAVYHAKRALLYGLALAVAEYFVGLNGVGLMSADGYRLDAIGHFLTAGIQYLFRAGFYFTVWYLYLIHSERVRVTYSS